MRRTLRFSAAVLAAFVVMMTASCMVREEITVDGSGAGTASVAVSLHPILLSYYSDLMSAMTSVQGTYPVFDLEAIAASFAERPAVDLVRIERSALGQLQLELEFDNINDVAASADATGAFSFRTIGSQREITIHLDRNIVTTFLAFAPPESAMMSEFLLPPSDGSVSREQYQEELAWALEEYAPATEVAGVLEDSVISVVVRPQGRIVSQSGGRIDGDAVVFSVPVLELLTLAQERAYGVVFEP